MTPPTPRPDAPARPPHPPDRLVTDPAELLVYECDAHPTHRARPGAVALCDTAAEVAAAVRWCADSATPFVPRGAGTGLSGGATPCAGALVVDTNRMHALRALDPANRFAVVEPGVLNAHISEAAAPCGLRYAPDPSSQAACTIGGNVAENAGGPHCFKLGLTVDHLAGVELVLPDGRTVRLGGPHAEPPGYDLTGLVTGSEGTFGVLTEATVRLIPAPRSVRTFLVVYHRMGDACRTVSAIVRAGIVPVAMEILDRNTIRAIEASVNAAGYPEDAAAVLLVELDGPEAGMDEDEAAIRAIADEHSPLSFHTAHDDAERLRLWKGRKTAFGTMGRVNTDLYVLDGVVPRTRLEPMLEETYRIAARHGVVLSNVFHAGDGNLHPNISYDGRDPDESARVQAAGREIMEACVKAGGTISGEHGIGNEKTGFMRLVFSEDDLDLFRKVKRAFDPAGLCNPGKVVPDARGAASGGDEGGAVAATSPADPAVSALCDAVRAAESDGHLLLPTGLGAHAWIGNPPPEGVEARTLPTRGFGRILDYEPDDYTIGVGAGVPLPELRRVLAEYGQEIPCGLTPSAHGTAGGLVARAPSDPRRGRYGPLAAFLLGTEGVRGGGIPFRSGGMVVKNVAGYALHRFLTGAHGTGAILTRVNFRLRPTPARRLARIASFSTADAAWEFATALDAALLEPAFLQVLLGDGPARLGRDGFEVSPASPAVAWLFEGSAATVAWQDTAATKLLRERKAPTPDAIEEAEAVRLLDHLALLADVSPDTPTDGLATVRTGVLPTELPAFTRLAHAVFAPFHPAPVTLAADALTGLITIRWRTEPDAVDDPLPRLTRLIRAHSATGVLHHLPAERRPLWNHLLTADPNRALARRVLAVLDPAGVFHPGRIHGTEGAATEAAS
ncbi:MAG: FAD-linked oxidase C-terminal domain-containing protein [Gemmatimonadota bacterium]|nr:FAD-linked oxidase C-terminal domain-containing protein [Gemmatimonadota bacterium]